MAKCILSNGSLLGLYGAKSQLNCFAGFGVRQLAATFSSCELAHRRTAFIQGPKHGQQAGLVESYSKLTHSKSLRVGLGQRLSGISGHAAL